MSGHDFICVLIVVPTQLKAFLCSQKSTPARRCSGVLAVSQHGRCLAVGLQNGQYSSSGKKVVTLRSASAMIQMRVYRRVHTRTEF